MTYQELEDMCTEQADKIEDLENKIEELESTV